MTETSEAADVCRTYEVDICVRVHVPSLERNGVDGGADVARDMLLESIAEGGPYLISAQVLRSRDVGPE